MRESIKIGLIVLTLIGVAGIGYFIWGMRSKLDLQTQYWQKKGFKTDTFMVKNYVSMPEIHFPDQVPPKTVYNYYPSTTSNKIQNLDSFYKVMDSLGKQLAMVNAKFLKFDPTASKLIRGKFSKDSLALDLLLINGNFQTLSYGVNYDKFRYQFINGKMEADPLPLNPFSKSKGLNIQSSLFPFGGWSFVDSKPQLGFAYELRYKRFIWLNHAEFIIENNPRFGLSTQIGWQLNN